jgi:hypothetical protein
MKHTVIGFLIILTTMLAGCGAAYFLMAMTSTLSSRIGDLTVNQVLPVVLASILLRVFTLWFSMGGKR